MLPYFMLCVYKDYVCRMFLVPNLRYFIINLINHFIHELWELVHPSSMGRLSPLKIIYKSCKKLFPGFPFFNITSTHDSIWCIEMQCNVFSLKFYSS